MSAVDTAARKTASTAGGKGRILVVDDDRLVLATVTHGLAQAGFDVIDADNGDDAILLAREHRPELALLDIRMEGKSGFDVAATLRDAYGIPFMFLSAFADEATLATVKSLGALAYLVKPLDVGQIVPAVEAAVAQLRSGSTKPLSMPVAGLGATTAAATARTGGLDDGPTDAPTDLLNVPLNDALNDPLKDALHDPKAEALVNAVPLAVGVLMHRFSLSRQNALARLQRLADEQKHSLHAQAERLLAAVEELARSG